MKIIVTPSECLDRGVWDEVCELKGLNPWAVNEGLIPSDEPIELTEDEARIVRVLR